MVQTCDASSSARHRAHQCRAIPAEQGVPAAGNRGSTDGPGLWDGHRALAALHVQCSHGRNYPHHFGHVWDIHCGGLALSCVCCAGGGHARCALALTCCSWQITRDKGPMKQALRKTSLSLRSLTKWRIAPLRSNPFQVQLAACRNLHVCQGRHGHQQEGGGSAAPHLVSRKLTMSLVALYRCPEEGTDYGPSLHYPRITVTEPGIPFCITDAAGTSLGPRQTQERWGVWGCLTA